VREKGVRGDGGASRSGEENGRGEQPKTRQTHGDTPGENGESGIRCGKALVPMGVGTVLTKSHELRCRRVDKCFFGPVVATVNTELSIRLNPYRCRTTVEELVSSPERTDREWKGG